MTSRADTVNMTTVQIHKDTLATVRELQAKYYLKNKKTLTQADIVEMGVELIEKELEA